MDTLGADAAKQPVASRDSRTHVPVLRGLAVWSGLLVAAVTLPGCGGAATGPEEALMAWVRAGQAAVEAEDRGELIDMISPAYQDARGNDRDSIDRLLRYYFLRQDTVGLATHIDDIEVIGDTAAEIVLTVGMAGTGSNTGLTGFRADAYRFALELTHDGSDWRLVSARWAELGSEPR